MVEFVKHLLGCCGEGHPSLLYLLGVTPIIAMRVQVMKWFSLVLLFVKSCLGRLYK